MNRTRPTRLTLTAGVLCASLAACSSGTDAVSTPAAASAPTTSAGAPAPAAAGSRAAGIPASALLQPADVGGAQPEDLAQGDFSFVRPLRPCGDDPYPSDESRSDAVAVRFTVEQGAEGSLPTVVTEFVGRHRAGGAAEQFDDVTAALEKCPGGLGENQRRWTSLGSAGAGDESVLVRIDSRESYADEEPATVSRYAALARVGEAIVVVADLGWENLGGSEDTVKELIGKAAERATTLS